MHFDLLYTSQQRFQSLKSVATLENYFEGEDNPKNRPTWKVSLG